MKGLIMAGGEGTRLRPLTCGKPKPMIDIMGKPVMAYIIELMKNAGITDIAVTLMYMPHIITDYFGDGSEYGVKLHYFTEESPLGTAGSVKNAAAFLDEPFVIISGDCLTDIDIRAAVDFHHAKDAEATILLTGVENPLEYGIVVTNEDGAIARFLEKPSWSEVFSDTANTGIYILNPSVLERIPQGEPYDFGKDLFPKMLSGGAAMYGYLAKGYWCDIGDLTAYRKCHFDILDKKVAISLDCTENGGVYMQDGAVIESGCQVTPPCYIGRGAVLRGGVKLFPYSVIGSDCRLSEGVSVKQTVIQRNTTVGKATQIRGGTIGENVHIGAHTMVLENAVIGEKTHIGDMCEIKNNIKIWPQKHISNETVVSDNLVWGDNFGRRLFGESGIIGEVNVDVTPEFATRLGAAFGAANMRAKLSISGVGGGAVDMLKNAFIAGMLSSGAKVYDFGSVALPVSRRAIPFYGLGGGVHISLARTGSELHLVITFMGKQGGDISRDAERKIETLFMREDFVRCEPNEITEVTTLYDYRYYYLREIMNEMGGSINIPVNIEGKEEAAQILSELGATVSHTDRKGIITAIVDDEAERLVLSDELGRLISGERYAALAALVAVRTGSRTLAIPTSAASTLEQIAQNNGARTVRCKTQKSQMMECMLKSNPVQCRLMFDAIYALAKICAYLSDSHLRLCDLADEIPEIHIVEREVRCDIGKKGMVIRSIADSASKQWQGGRVELEEGVKIINDNGWVLIILHTEKPVCRVISEGVSEEYADELCNMYIEKVADIAKESE